MGERTLFHNLSIHKKILFTFTSLFILILFLILMAAGASVFFERKRDIERELGSITRTVIELVKSNVRLIASDRLESDVKSVLSVMSYLYDEEKGRGVSDDQIKEDMAAYLNSYRIGSSGYLYVLDDLGDVVIHPYEELVGESLIEYEFIRTQVKEKSGYLEYQWKNPGEEGLRDKALYMDVFEPYGWILSASAYREEFLDLVRIDDMQQNLDNISVGEQGNIFVLDRAGNFLIHSRFAGRNIRSLTEEEQGGDFSYLLEIPEKRNGEIFYKETDPVTGRPVGMALLYRYLPELDWIVASTIPINQYTRFFRRFAIFGFLFFLVGAALFFFLSNRFARQLTGPLFQVMDFIDDRKLRGLSERLDGEGRDEFSQLKREINEFLDAIEEERNNRLIAEEENRILAQFTNGNPYPVMRIDGKGNILYVNKASIELMKYWDIAFSTRLPEDLVAMIREFGADFADFEYKKKNRIYNIMLSYFENQNSYYLLLSDITVRKEDEYLLMMSESVFSHTMEGIVITEADGTIMRINPAFTHITGYTEEDAMGANPRILKSKHHKEEFYRDMWHQLHQTGTWSGEIWNRRKNGEPYPEWLTINSVCDERGSLIHYVGIFKDISDIKESEEKLRYQVSHDALTSLPNRILFEDRLNRAIARAERNRNKLAVLFLDMDNFKHVNDSLGHQTGDDYLKIIASRIVQSCRDEDTVARLGGDEFVVLIPELTEELNIIEIADRIQKTVGAPLIFHPHELHPTVSIGVTIFPEDGNDPLLLMKNADLAMYKAKDMGKGTYSLFNREMNDQVRKRMELESQLRRSLQKGEIFMLYQPKVSVPDGEIIGVEALVRWQNSTLGLVSPVDFIPLAEETGFILKLGDWVLEKTLTDMSGLTNFKGQPLEIAVNLSARQFRDDKLIGRIGKILKKSSVSPAHVNFEITESAAMDESEASLEIIKQLKQLGVRISIDDFGTGYSSYSYLNKFRVDCLKVDKSFVDEVPRDRSTTAIMKNIIDLGHTLDMEVVAEGVELEEQLRFLTEARCDVIQGYYFYKPLSLEELKKVLSR